MSIHLENKLFFVLFLIEMIINHSCGSLLSPLIPDSISNDALHKLLPGVIPDDIPDYGEVILKEGIYSNSFKVI